MSDNGGFGMGGESISSITKYPVSVTDSPEIFAIHPLSRFVQVTTLAPSCYPLPDQMI